MSTSIVIPFYNEEASIGPLADELSGVMAGIPDCEALFVDDGSVDATWEKITASQEQHSSIRGIRSLRNEGQTAAVLKGLAAARGEVLVLMDGDMQNNPADIPRLLEELREHDVVCGFRANRKDTWSRRAGSLLANKVRNWVTHDGLVDTGCSLKAFRRPCLADIPPLVGAHRFLGAYFRLHGRSIVQVPVDHRPRQHGTSKYTNLKRLPRTVYDLFGFAWYRRRLIRQET